jgi:hypothetical protein
MNIAEARNHLERLNEQYAEAVQRRDVAAYRAIRSDLLTAQRNVQQLAGGEFAMPLDGGAGWVPTHPNPLVFSDGFVLWVICPIASAQRPLLCRVVRFGHVLAHRAGITSDSLEEQPLFGRGLESCKALEVRNSLWIEQLKRTISDAALADVRHFAFCFKDCLIEVMAKSIEWLPEQWDVEVCIAEFSKNSTMITSVKGKLSSAG